MTRFARAKGSKSSNERVPEQATSWSEMRRDLHRESVRKAAEEQIERESHSKQLHNFEESMPDTCKAKVKEPLELAPFDVEPRLIIPKPQYPKISVTEKALKKNDHHDVPQQNKVQCHTPETTVSRKSEQSLSKTQMALSRLACTTSEILHSDVPLPVFSTCPSKSEGSSQKMRVKSGFGKPSVPTGNKRKFQNESKSSREGDSSDSEPQIGGNFKGYPVPVEDAETLTDAYNILRKEGLTHKQAMDRIKPERRRAEKRLVRLKSMICFRCRKPGHRLSDCPMGDIDCAVCFKCGSTTHKYQDCKKKGSFVNAKCFICGVVGHLSAQCPENSHGVYPQGGECKICGEKSHLVKDCPQNRNKKDLHPGTTEFDDYFDEKPSEAVEPTKKKIKTVQF